tara:strand:- start:918 stop:1109 length:192 start_codon:yes stop_codon:yes gene_type:complete
VWLLVDQVPDGFSQSIQTIVRKIGDEAQFFVFAKTFADNIEPPGLPASAWGVVWVRHVVVSFG